jgi:mRNA interferase MazF
VAVGAGYVRGMVVNVDLPRLDAPGSWKERPALIVSTEDFHRTRPDDLLVALVTHRIWKYHGSTDYLLQDWQAAGLTQPSVVRSSLYLLLRSDVKSVRGSLISRDLQGVEASLRRALGL